MVNTVAKENVTLDDVSLESANSSKFLGVIIDETFHGKITLMQYPRLLLETLEC